MTSAVVGAADDVGVIILGEANRILNTQGRWIDPGASDQALDVTECAELSQPGEGSRTRSRGMGLNSGAARTREPVSHVERRLVREASTERRVTGQVAMKSLRPIR
jgi:hypothetical protein